MLPLQHPNAEVSVHLRWEMAGGQCQENRKLV